MDAMRSTFRGVARMVGMVGMAGAWCYEQTAMSILFVVSGTGSGLRPSQGRRAKAVSGMVEMAETWSSPCLWGHRSSSETG